MKNTLKRAISIMLVAVMLFGTSPIAGFVGLELPEMNLFTLNANAEESATSGTCGENLTWEFIPDSNTLSISGYGRMLDYSLSSVAPWYNLAESITHIELPDKLTSIGNYAFVGCKNIFSIHIPEFVYYIGESAFKDCENLNTVNVPYGTVEIGESAFSSAKNLTELFIPDTVRTIGSSAFRNTNLLELTIPNSVTNLNSENLFNSCLSLTKVTLPENITSLDDGMFYGCKSLQNINIPNSVKYIGEDTFRDCISLTGINLPDNLLSIKDDAFYGCTGISSISIPKTVKMVDGNAFYKCTNLKNISIPDEVTGLTAGNFSKTAYYDDPDNWDDGVLYIGKHLIAVDQEKISPYYTVRNGTKTIAEQVFSPMRPQDSKIRSITLPDGLTSIGCLAFAGCQSLTTISIPDSVTDISDSAFANTAYYNNSNNWTNGVLYIDNHLIKVDESFNGDLIVDDGTRTIADAALMDCNLITSVSIPSSVTNIGDSAFKGCVSLVSVNFAENSNLNYMGISAFESCSKLKSITIPEGIYEISESSFTNCKNLQNITIPSSVSRIGDYAFWNCLILEDIILPSQMSYIGKRAFMNCEKFNSITIPFGVSKISERAFEGCVNLKNVVIPNTIKSIEFRAFNECGFDTIIIPESVTEIDGYAFQLCRNLTSVAIPQGVTCISVGTFDSCTSLTGVTLPEGITVIESSAFINCSSLTDIHIPGSVTRIGAGAFCGCNNLKKIIIPDSVVVIEESALSTNYKSKSVIEYIHIPNSVKIIENQSFEYTRMYICSDTEDCYAKIYAESNDVEFKLCDGKHSIEADENTNSLKLIYSSPTNNATAVSYNDDLMLGFNQNIKERFGPESAGYGELAIRNYDTDETVFSTYDFFAGESMSSLPRVQANCLKISGAFKRIEPGEKYYIYLSPGTIRAETDSTLSFEGFTDKDDFTFSYQSSSVKKGAYIDVYSSQPMVNIAPDEEIEIKAVLSRDGEPCKQEGITFSIADSSVAEITEIVKQSESTRVIIRGKKQGATPLNITATHDNVSCSVPITVTTEKTVYYSTDLEQFYNGNPLFIDGMFIDNFDIEENDDGSAEYKFDVYNGDCCIGAVDVYTSSGERIKSVMIDKFDGDYPSNIFEHTETAMKMLWHIGDYLDVDQYKGSTQTEKTSVSVYVPANGYFTITKSILVSDSCAIYNISNLGFEVVSSVAKKLKTKESEITKDLAEDILSEEQEKYIEFIDKIGQSFLKKEFKLTIETASGFTDELLENTGKLFVAAGKPIIESIVDVAKKYFEEDIYNVLFSVTWGGVVKDILDNFYAPIKVSKLLSQILLIYEYVDYRSVYVYQIQSNGERISNGVKAKSEILKDNVIFHSVTITSGDEVDYVKSLHNPDVHCDIFDISVIQNGENAELNYPVTVYIPIPAGWDQNKISVYHVGDDNKHEKLSVTIENGYIKFTTDDFSPFVIADSEINFIDYFAINNLNNSATINYGDTLLLSVNDLTLPEGAYVNWEIVSGEGVTLNQSEGGKTCGVTSVSNGTVTVRAVIVDKNGIPIKNGLGDEISSEQTITSKAGFFQKIISFFKNLFRMKRTVVQSILEDTL